MASKERIPSAPYLLVRLVFAILIGLALLAPAEAFAKGHATTVPRKYAGIVVDAKSGKVLYEQNADAARYPASVTKVMTLYILFQELKAGNITMDTKFTVSKWAASASPTKLGLKAGSQIRVEDCIKAIVTISANDMARVIAENISGSESAFAKRMTATAKALGMMHTTYHNASGLPDAGQITTVRDQARLGAAIYEHFPDYYEYFQTKSFSYGRRTYGSHNYLIGHDGIDGIKTGYINASGYNLLTAARTDGRHIVVAGFGFDSGGSRDAKVRDLVRSYLPQARQGGYLDAALVPIPGRKGATVLTASAAADSQPVVPAAYPSFRLDDHETAVASAEDVIETPPVPAPQMVAEAPVVPLARPASFQTNAAVQAAAAVISPAADTGGAPLEIVGAWVSDTFDSLGAAPAPLGETVPSAPLIPPAPIGKDIDPTTSGSVVQVAMADPAQPEPAPLAPAAVSAPAPAAPTVEGWIVQVGAAPTETGANSLLDKATKKLGDLGGAHPFVEKFEKDGQLFFRARFGGFGGRTDATGLCNQLKKAKMSCLAMQS